MSAHTATLSRLQRRRFRRARLEDSSSVQVEALASDPFACEGVVLNISPDGLACLIGRADADRLVLDDRVRVRFEIAGEAGAFLLEARVRAKTPASRPASVVLGMQFDGDHASTRVRLADTLRERGQRS